MIKKQTTMARTSFGMLADAASITVAPATDLVFHGSATRVRIPGTPAWSPPVC